MLMPLKLKFMMSNMENMETSSYALYKYFHKDNLLTSQIVAAKQKSSYPC